MNHFVKTAAVVGVGALVVRSMLKAAESAAAKMAPQGVNDYFPRAEFIDAQSLARSDDPAALGFLLGCAMDGMGCTGGDGMGCADVGGMGCADVAKNAPGLGYNIFNDPWSSRQRFEGGRNRVANMPTRGLTSGADPMGAPTRNKPTGLLSMTPNFNRPIVAVARGGRGMMRGGLGDADGLGFSFKKIFKAPSKVIKKITAPVKKVVSKVTKAAKKDLSKVANIVKKDIKRVNAQIRRDATNIIKPVKRDFSNALNLLRAKDPLFKKLMPLKPQMEESSATGEVEYLDGNGNVITQAQFDQLEAEAAAWNQQMADMEATAPGEIQFEESTGLYWSQDASGSWFQWDNVAKGWKADAPSIATDPYEAMGLPEPEAQPSSDLPEGVTYDAGTNLYWWQDASGNWYYYDEGTGNFIMESPESEMSAEYLPDNNAEQSYLDQIMLDEAGASSEEVEAFFDEGTGLYWYQEPDGTYWWWSEDVQEWQPDAPLAPTVVEHETGTGGGFWSWLFDWGKGGMGYLTSRQSGNRLYVLRTLGKKVEAVPLKADKHGKVYADIGGGMGCLGCLDDLAGAEGLGFKLFGRSWGEIRENVEKVAKDVAGTVTPSGIVYKYMKEKKPKLYREFHREVKSATPYVAIVAGTAITVVSLGAASPVGVATIAAGVAQIGAQAYSDNRQHAANKAEDAAQYELDQAVALESAGRSAVASNNSTPWFSWDWWMGDVDPNQTSLLTVGEQL